MKLNYMNLTTNFYQHLKTNSNLLTLSKSDIKHLIIKSHIKNLFKIKKSQKRL